ncbi:MAG: hypothetical protein ACKOA4_12075, partial [Haliscomenobacter sp.]
LLKEIVDLLAPGQVGDRFLDDGFKHPFLHACGLRLCVRTKVFAKGVKYLNPKLRLVASHQK